MLDANQREHTNSYYAATQRDKTPFPTLSGDVTTDICIIGGGLTGVSTALELAEQGRDVVLLEAHRIGWGASGRNGGQIIGGYGGKLTSKPDKTDKRHGKGTTDKLVDMGNEAVEIIKQRIQKYQIECDLKWGFLNVALKQREMDDLGHWYDELKEQGYEPDIQMVDKEGLRDYVGTDRYIGGMVDMGWGHLQVLDLCKGEARAAANLGAQIFEQTIAQDVEHGDTIKVKTEHGTVHAKQLILCGNAYLAALAPKLAPKLTKYVLPATSYIIATEPLSDEQVADVMPKNYAVCDQRTALDYFRLSADNRMLFGGVSNYTASAPRSITTTLRNKMLKVFPQLSDAEIDYYWGGRMGISFRRVPQLGQLAPNVFYAQAYSGHGVAPTHMTGRILAETLNGDRSRFDIMAKETHVPFPGFGMIRQSMYAVGMSFYKIRDAIM